MSKHVDDIYDRLVRREDLKNGTKYERLAGIVFRLLTQRETVHDVRLRGESTVKHQIDVVVGDARRRVIVEAKDYEKKVGLGTVRDFRSVVEEIKPDEAFVVSREGFTRDAIRFAGAKGMRLAVLRPVGEARGDLDNRARKIVLKIHLTVPVGEPRVFLDVGPETPDEHLGSTTEAGSEVWIEYPDRTREPLRDVLETAMAAAAPELGTRGTKSGALEAAGWHFVFPDGRRFEARACRWEQDWRTITSVSEAGEGIGGLAAELIFKTIDGEIDEIFTNHALQEWTFSADGAVTRASH